MKVLFSIVLVVLLGASFVTWFLNPEIISDQPLLYWTTGNDSIRQEQLRLFEEWREENGLPPMEIRIDNANRDISKRLIQGVSGVAADLIDCYNTQLQLFQAVGMLSDLSEPARAYGFDADRTYKSVRDDLMAEGRQWGFPLNVTVLMYWTNLDAFRKVGMSAPPHHWDVETFEAWGLEYLERVRRLDPGGRYFFANAVHRLTLGRSFGVSLFNETLTGTRLDNEAYRETLRTISRWVNDYHLIPTPEEEEAFAVEAGGRDTRIALFAQGKYAMLFSGRFALTLLREHGDINLSVSYAPYKVFENALITSSIISLYKDSQHKEEAYRFFEFLTSEAYNMKIVRDGDSLPPIPEYIHTREFRRPPDFPNEWGSHEFFSEAAEEHAIGRVQSPFILYNVVERIEAMAFQTFMAGKWSVEEAGRSAESRINAQIRQNLEDHPELLPEFEKRMEIQKKIDTYFSEGRAIPEEWVYNAFHRAYYRELGLLQENEQ